MIDFSFFSDENRAATAVHSYRTDETIASALFQEVVMHGICLFAITAFLMASISGEIQSVKEKKATSAEQAFKYLLEAAKADDVDGFLVQLGGHSRAVLVTGWAMEKYEAALDERFGKKDRLGNRLSMRRELGKYKTQTFEIRSQVPKGVNRVALNVRQMWKAADGHQSIGEEVWIGVKEESGWKIIFPEKGLITEVIEKKPDGREIKVQVLKSREISDEESASIQKMLTGIKESLDELTKNVTAGKYRTRDEAEAARQDGRLRSLKK